MRVKAVLRDADILKMEPGSKERILATVSKNLDRVVNFRSLLKVMGLKWNARLSVLKVLSEKSIHIWLLNDLDQHLIYLSENETPKDPTLIGYQWQ